MAESTIGDMQAVFDPSAYATRAREAAPIYMNATPFPHIAFDNFLPQHMALDLARVYPTPDNLGWTTHTSPKVNRQFLGDETKYHSLFRAFSRSINSRRFILFLETLSGIRGLVGDPYFVGGGAMTAGAGHKLDMHIDFNWHYGLRAYRRLNALFYLTPDWQENWGGHLRVESEDKRVSHDYVPYFNRLIVFSTSEGSWHGQPVPLACPADIRRNVFSAFYYTAASPEQETDPHLTRYREETPYTAAPYKNFQIESD
jgi:hypothetical protein